MYVKDTHNQIANRTPYEYNNLPSSSNKYHQTNRIRRDLQLSTDHLYLNIDYDLPLK